MQLKQRGYCFGVLLIHAITTVTLPPVGLCDSAMSSSQPHLAPRNVRTRALITSHPLKRGGRRRPRLDPRRGGESTSAPRFHRLDSADGPQSAPPGGRPGQTPGPRMSTDGSVRDEPKQSEEWELTYASPTPPYTACSEGSIKPVVHGKFYITGQLKANIPNVGYQSDSAVSGQERIRGQQLRDSEQIWQRLQPAVECGDHAMTLTVRRRRAVQLLLDRANESSVPLSQLPPQCGYSVQTTWRDLSLMAQYDACHVTQEGGGYVLPLLWRGTPVKMSCPASETQSPSLCCSPHGMTVTVTGLSTTEMLRVNVRGEWTPLVALAEQCGYTLDARDAEIIITAPFITCGMSVKDGKYTLSLQTGEKTFTLACPVSGPEELPLTPQPLLNSPHLTSGPTAQTPEYLEPVPWAPPFYLAPPYYPHPTYHYKYPRPDGHDAYNPSTPPSSTPGTSFGPQPLPPVDSQPHYQMYPDLQQKHETHVSEKHSAVEAPPLQPHSHAFNQYYHYYHYPKIPLPDPPQDLDPGPEIASLTTRHNPESPLLPRSVQKSEALGRFNFFQPEPEASSHLYTLPTSPPYTPPQPYPNHDFSYFPFARGEAKRTGPLSPDMAAHLSDYQNTKSSTFVDPLPHVSEVHDQYKLYPYTGQPDPDLFRETPPDWIKPPQTEDGLDTDAVPPPERSSFPSPSSNHNFPPLHPYYHPYYHYYQMHYEPDSLLSTDSRTSPTSSKRALNTLLQPAASPLQHLSQKPLTTPPPTKSVDDVHDGNLHPYYYYLYYQHEMPVDNQEVHPASSMNSESQPPSHYSEMGRLVQAAEAGYPSIPRSNPFQSLYPHDVPLQSQHDPFRRPETEERLANEMKDCTVGRSSMFAVPDSMVEPTVLQLAHPSEVSNASCTLQKLTAHPDIYIVPLDGCGLHKHMFGQAVAHLLDVYGIHSPLQDPSDEHENSPVRLMECSSSTCSPGEVWLHATDQPPPPPVQSTPVMVTVQLRLATDESFTSFHPEAHLPLSIIRGRPVYLEVSLLNPPESGLVLLVYSCLVYTEAPYASWMPVYNGCSSWGDAQLFVSPRSDHIRRIIISSFLSLPRQSPIYTANRGSPALEDPEIIFLCLVDVCSAADDDCTVGCINSSNSGV